jgi:tRNA threonylcarbamoyladenosine biosynthesis protein TsaB
MEPLILSIETATLGGSVCLAKGIKVLAITSGDPALSHSNTLLSDINDCLQQGGASVSDVELFAAASGPGSFTGLRIGLATIKGLAATLKRPCVGIPTLQAIAHSAGISDATVSLLPAGRGEVFVQLISVSADDVAELDQAAHLPPASAVERYATRQTLRWAGSAALLHRDLIHSMARQKGIGVQESLAAEAQLLDNQWQLVSGDKNLAYHVGSIAAQRYRRNDLELAETLSAIYVRPSDAELKCN